MPQLNTELNTRMYVSTYLLINAIVVSPSIIIILSTKRVTLIIQIKISEIISVYLPHVRCLSKIGG